jgi:hypothetical protein
MQPPRRTTQGSAPQREARPFTHVRCFREARYPANARVHAIVLEDRSRSSSYSLRRPPTLFDGDRAIFTLPVRWHRRELRNGVLAFLCPSLAEGW